MMKYMNLGELCNKITDGTHHTPTYTEEGIPFLRVTDITESNQSKKFISKIEHLELIKRCNPEKGDILYTKNGTIGVAKKINWDYDFSIFVSLCLLKPNINLVNTDYLVHYLNTKLALNQALSHTKTGTISNLHLIEIKKIKIPLPPLETQQKIAAILDAADTLRQKDKALVAKYDELTQALFLDMFGDPFVNQQNHPYIKLESLVKSKSDLVDGPFGSSVNTKVDYIENGEIPVIRTKNVKLDNTFSSDDLKFMTRKKYESVIRSQVLPGDIVLTKVGTIGNVCVFPETYQEAVLSTTGSCRIRVDESLVNKQYLLIYLNFYKTKMLEIAAAGVQAFLNMKHIKGFDILMPTITLQTQFAERLAIIEQQKAIAQASLEKSEELFNSLLQKAFKGELN